MTISMRICLETSEAIKARAKQEPRAKQRDAGKKKAAGILSGCDGLRKKDATSEVLEMSGN